MQQRSVHYRECIFYVLVSDSLPRSATPPHAYVTLNLTYFAFFISPHPAPATATVATTGCLCVFSFPQFPSYTVSTFTAKIANVRAPHNAETEKSPYETNFISLFRPAVGMRGY
jgi:hypothetical protein